MEPADPADHLDISLESHGNAQHRCRAPPVSLRLAFASESLGAAGTRGQDCYIVAASAVVYNAIGRLLACIVRIGAAHVAPLQSIEGGALVWLFSCTRGAGFALASAHSWQTKTKWFSGPNR